MASLFHDIQKAEQELLFLQSQIEFVQSDYMQLKGTYHTLLSQLQNLSQTPLTVGQFVEFVNFDPSAVDHGQKEYDDKMELNRNTSSDYAIVQPSTSNSNALVRISSSIDKSKLAPLTTVALSRHSQSILKILPSENDTQGSMISVEKRPKVTYNDIGGYDAAKLEIRECIEVPLKNPEIFRQLNIQPPNACLLHGPPGCSKSMLVKAVANACDCTFINISSPSLVNKYLGEGARQIRDIFRLARDNSPAILFFDEIDAIAGKRSDSSTEGDKEISRILLELLTNLDGFNNEAENKGGAAAEEHPGGLLAGNIFETLDGRPKAGSDGGGGDALASSYEQEKMRGYHSRLLKNVVKVIFATNKPETLDPALVRTGRADRKIFMDFPSKRDKRLIFQVCSRNMMLKGDVDFEIFVNKNQKISGADIQGVCSEAGMSAIRNNRYVIAMEDFEQAYAKVVGRRNTDEAMI